MKTCKIGADKYFLKFSDERLFDPNTDPSLQILVEHLAYSIYSLYPNISIPQDIQLVFDADNQKVGLATKEIQGKMALSSGISAKKLAKMMSAGIFVDVLLANWDVVGTGSGNIMTHGDTATRIDPGGALTYRAQGGRKGRAFGEKPTELNTMLKPGMGAGDIYQYADLKEAAQTFLSVPWSKIHSKIVNVVNTEILPELQENGMSNLASAFKKEVKEIDSILQKRYTEIVSHIRFILKEK